MRPFHPEAKGPLDGIRVLDLSRLVAGNMLSLQLADFGAEVIKVEDPAKGDPLRDWRVKGISAHWKVYARNKKSITLDLREAEGRDLLLRLVAGAQVFIENFRPGTLEEMGLAPARLLACNPRLIIVRVSGWGQDGPYRDRPGFGSLVEGMSGFAAKNRVRRSAPGFAAACAGRHDRRALWRLGGAGGAARERGERRRRPGHRPPVARSDRFRARSGGRDLQVDR